jgi:hypothetical protein
MNTQVGFALRGRNPDVLTCIANLSNDEVFTPPEFANRMLVRHLHPGVYVPDRFPGKHATGCDHQVRARVVPDRHGLDRQGLPFTRAAQGIQYRAHEPGRVCIPAIRRCITPPHGHRKPSRADPLWAV